MPFWFILLSSLLLQTQPADLKTECTTQQTPEVAIAACTAAIAADLDDAELYLYRGYAYLLNENWVEAIADYDTLIDLDPKNADAYYNRGFAWENFGDQAAALTNYTTALELDPTYIDAYINRGLLYTDEGEYEKALIDFNSVLELDPNSVEGWDVRGYVNALQGDYDAALEAYSEVIELDPDNGRAYEGRGHALLSLGDYRRSIRDYDRALELDVFDPIELYYGRAFAQAALGNYEEALVDYDAALAINLRPDILVNRAEVYFALGDYETALLEYQRILELNTEYNAYCYMGIARIGERTEQLDLSLEAANEWVAIMQQYELFTEGELPSSERATFEVSFEQQWAIAYAQYDTAAIIATAFSQSGDIDPVLMLLDPNGEVVAFNDNSFELDGRDARIGYGVRIPDIYTVIVTYIGDNSVGDVQLVMGPIFD